MALRAGVDVDLTYEPAYMGPMVEMVQNGDVPEWLVDRAVRRVLELKFRLGLFEHPYVDLEHAKQVMHSQEHQDLALQAAREGIVLLKNEGNVLPLKKQMKSIAVIGPDADDAWSQLGDYSPSAVPYKMTTILDGIRQKAGPAGQGAVCARVRRDRREEGFRGGGGRRAQGGSGGRGGGRASRQCRREKDRIHRWRRV